MNTYGKLGRLWVLGSLLAAVAACAQRPPHPAGPAGEWQQRCELIQQHCQAMGAAKTPEERQKLMEAHWQFMREHKMMPDGCPVGTGMTGGAQGMGPGMMGQGMAPGMMMGPGQGAAPGMMMGQGMGPGPMIGSPTVEQLDQRIQHVEAMLKMLKEQRAKMGK